MCGLDESFGTIENSYWYPHQWNKAFAAALWESKSCGKRMRVFRISFGNGGYGWVTRYIKE